LEGLAAQLRERLNCPGKRRQSAPERCSRQQGECRGEAGSTPGGGDSPEPRGSWVQSCRHLVTRLQGDAALWLAGPGERNRGRARCLVNRELRRTRVSGRIAKRMGSAFGFLSAVTAALAGTSQGLNSAKPFDLVPALRRSFHNAFLAEYGHGPVQAASQASVPALSGRSPDSEPMHKLRGCRSAGCRTCGKLDDPESVGTIPMPFLAPMFGPAAGWRCWACRLENVHVRVFGKLLTLGTGAKIDSITITAVSAC